jgi:hypothetical protein
MKQLTTRFAAAALLLAGLGTTSQLFAQSNEVRATVPFNFIVADKQMPAGRYQFFEGSDGLLYIRNLQQPIAALSQISGRDGIQRNDNNLVFHKYGTRYFLSEVHSRSMIVNGDIPRSKLEKQSQEASVDHATTLVAAE